MKIYFFLVISIFCFPYFLLAQEEQKEKDVYEWFDAVTGLENTSLFTGIEYKEEHVMINEKHKFFLTSLFKPGTIYYEGQAFYNINMKYNIYDDLLVVRLPKTGGGEETFKLNSGKVQGFQMEGHKFLNIITGEEKSLQSGFQEVLFETRELKLFKDHERRIFLRRDGSYPYHEFNDPGAEYTVMQKEQFFRIKNRRDLINIFPEYEQVIKNYYKVEGKLQKSNPDDFMIGLFEAIENKGSINSRT